MSVKISFRHYKNYITWTRVKVPVVCEDFIWFIFFGFFYLFTIIVNWHKVNFSQSLRGASVSGSWSHFYTMPIVIRILCEKINNVKISLQIQELRVYPLSLTGYFSRVQEQCLLDFFVFFYVKVASQLSLVSTQQLRRLCQL